MADSIKINKLEIENVKRIKAVKIEPTKNGLTIVGGNNNQGKTSVLDSIAWALGGDRYKPYIIYSIYVRRRTERSNDGTFIFNSRTWSR